MTTQSRIEEMIRDEYSGDRTPRPDVLAARIAQMVKSETPSEPQVVMVDLQWLVGISVTTALGLGSIMIAAFVRLSAAVSKVKDVAIDGDNRLHERINKLRDATVLKADLDSDLRRISDDMREMREEHRQASVTTNARLDAVLSAIANRNKKGE